MECTSSLGFTKVTPGLYSCFLVIIWHVFFQALWTQFFPVSYEVRKLLNQDEVGDVQMVRAEVGKPVTHVPRCAERELGGGALLVMGMYCLQFVFMAFNGEKPESIQAIGHRLDTGDCRKKVDQEDIFALILYLYMKNQKSDQVA